MGFVGHITAEILAILAGLDLAWRSGHRFVVVESDCTEAIDAVMGVCAGNQEDRALAQECREILSRDWCIEIKHICREAIRIAG